MTTWKKQGLYNPKIEHDACGIAMLADIKGKKTHTIVQQALTALERLHHRGGRHVDGKGGDGSGILTELPHALFSAYWEKRDRYLPDLGEYGVGMIFLPQDVVRANTCKAIIESALKEEVNLHLFGWRIVPTDEGDLDEAAKQSQPAIYQLFVTTRTSVLAGDALERALYIMRRKAEKRLRENKIDSEDCYIASFSSRTIIYKGLMLPKMLGNYYGDLHQKVYQSAFAMVHNRFSTNTFPSWRRAQPNRFVMHNGEINTITGNVHWMLAREATFRTDLLEDFESMCPVIDTDGSDSAMFDNTLEYLVMSGWSLARAMMLMVPEPWQNNTRISAEKKAFYQYHSRLMEPWDGPAALGFTNGKQIGACLDRNGLRPARFVITEDDFMYLSSELGVVDIPEEKIIQKGRLKPGEMLLVDFEKKKLFFDEELKQLYVQEHPYKEWTEEGIISIDAIDNELKKPFATKNGATLLPLQKAFGYTYEEWEKVIKRLALEGQDPVGSMGYDAPLAVLSEQPQLLFHYFKQRFAQVTNPPIDSIRESYVTSMDILLGETGQSADNNTEYYKNIKVDTPILSEENMGKIKSLENRYWKTTTLYLLCSAKKEENKLERVLQRLLREAEAVVRDGCRLLVLSDRGVNKENHAIPSLLAVSAVHHHLLKTGLRSKVSLIVESGEPREVHHFATLLGYGASAVYPYLVYSSLMVWREEEGIDADVETNYVKGITKGLLKIMSKMGISTVQSYIGAQLFEAVGINCDVIDDYFPGTPSQIEGLSLEDIAREATNRHDKAWQDENSMLEEGSDFQWRQNGENHLYRPETIHTLQQACRTGEYELFKKYSGMLREDAKRHTTLRGMLRFKSNRKSIPLEEVEPVESIFKRFKTGAMSYGSISKEAHEALAIAMNRIGGKSNSGEGGEDPERYKPLPNGDSKLSRVKQVASGRFGVTSYYLVNSDEIQIKMAQGAKPGEGGQLAGHKVSRAIAKRRGSTPGIELISPPPHHDIYSIEDLEQLIYDLKNANPRAAINVKLVAGTGVGTIAAGVAKAKADVILISGYDGGTGAAAKTSIKHAGLPWELGLAEAHQTLMLNGLRNKVKLETDGKLMNGRDVVIAALLGAEEFGFSTLPLVALGCVMMRVCHLDTCPVGIATQNPELRKKMTGNADHIVQLMTCIAKEVREYMASLGFRSIDDMVGRTDVLQVEKQESWKSRKIDLSPILLRHEGERICSRKQDHELSETVDYQKLLPISRAAWKRQKSVEAVFPINNTNRSVGTMTGSELSRQFGEDGLPEDMIRFRFQGTAGQSFGAFVPKGLTMMVEGAANDYVGKGLSGGKIVVRPSEKSGIAAEENVIIGNAACYGATSGKVFIRGKAGERFCVRNSGAYVVAEGAGDHGCEYMTGGRAILLGEVGKNFAAGMSGGIAYIYEPANQHFLRECNKDLLAPLERLEDQEELEFLYSLIKDHLHYTESPVAYRLIQHWREEADRFIRVIPHQYKQILERERSTGIVAEIR